MTSHLLPAPSAIVEMTAADDPAVGVRVAHAEGETLTLSMALAAVPALGATVTLRWPAGYRGRYAREVLVTGVEENQVTVRAAGPVLVEQQRNFVRGGGGEQVFLVRPGHPDAAGWIRDISEQSIRAYFADVEVAEGDEVELRMSLEPDLVEMTATVSKAACIPQRVPGPGSVSVEFVAVFATDEPQAQIIRRYVLRHQLLMRTRTAG